MESLLLLLGEHCLYDRCLQSQCCSSLLPFTFKSKLPLQTLFWLTEIGTDVMWFFHKSGIN